MTDRGKTHFHVDNCPRPGGCHSRVDCNLNRKCLFTAMPLMGPGEMFVTSNPKQYQQVEFPDGKGFTRHGSPTFYKLLDEMANIHDSKSHDYASESNPYGNYLFAGQLAKLFDNADDSGFIGRVGEKIYRLANLENDGKIPSNESVEDTERDICTIIALWVAFRRDKRHNNLLKALQERIKAQTTATQMIKERNTGDGS